MLQFIVINFARFSKFLHEKDILQEFMDSVTFSSFLVIDLDLLAYSIELNPKIHQSHSLSLNSAF